MQKSLETVTFPYVSNDQSVPPTFVLFCCLGNYLDFLINGSNLHRPLCKWTKSNWTEFESLNSSWRQPKPRFGSSNPLRGCKPTSNRKLQWTSEGSRIMRPFRELHHTRRLRSLQLLYQDLANPDLPVLKTFPSKGQVTFEIVLLYWITMLFGLHFIHQYIPNEMLLWNSH